MNTTETTSPAEQRKQNSWAEFGKTVFWVLLITFVFRSFFFEPFHIPSGSMKSNLLVGDYLFVSKYSYGYSRYSFPFSPPLFQGRILEFHQPERGDVVVFRLPSDTSIDYIKRIIGMPGDQIQVKESIVYINGKPLPRTPDGIFLDREDPEHVRSIPRFHETLPGGKVITILQERTTGFANNTPVYSVPPGEYFMMGDNRDDSRDSRFPEGVGYVPAENLVGPARIIAFSFGGDTLLRFNRFLKIIH